MKKTLYRTIEYIFSIFIFIVVINNCVNYAKTMDINGIKAELNVEVTKESVNKGVSVNDGKEQFSTTDYEKDKKESEDKFVNVELIVKNNNPYESANVTIEEIAPSHFRQTDSNKQDKTIKVKIDSKKEKKYNLRYSYHKSIFIEQESSIRYDDNGNIISNDKNSNIYDKERTNNSNESTSKSNTDDVESDLNKGIANIIILILTFIACVILLYVFRLLYRTIKGNDDRFFGDYDDPFKRMAIFLTITIAFSLISHNSKALAENRYLPQIYEYGKSYEKVIYEAVDFNGLLYRFAYKITVSFESNYNVTDEDYELDTDGDLLVDALEYQYMTDKTNVDTDNDGLIDYMEVMFLDYNPLSENTFKDSTKDGDRDYDGDGLTNIEEVRLGTDLCNIDTDYDTLSDYDEINKYNTDPLDVDTDEDYLIDPDELKLGLDPTKARTDGVTLDSERKIEQNYSMTKVPEELREGDIYFKEISGKVSGVIDNNITIQQYLNENISNSKATIDFIFKVDSANDDIVEIKLDASKVADRVKYMVVVKYEDSTFEPIETICNEDNELIATISRGVYTIVDSDLLLRELNIYNNDYTP